MKTTTGRMMTSVVLAVACASVSGCFVLPKPKPFTRPVAAKQLDMASLAPVATVAAPEPVAAPQGEAVPASDITIAGSLIAPTPAPASPPQEPERTNVQGLGDGSMDIDRVVVRASTIQQRAPNYSSEQAAAIACDAIKENEFVDNALRMHAATVKAEQARRDLDAEKITGKQLDEIELARQDAVINYLLPIPVLNWFFGPTQKKADLPAPESGPVTIRDTDLFTFTENGREVIAVSGVVSNASGIEVTLPPVTLRALDEWEFSIAGQTSLFPFEKLGPRESKPFELRFLNPPANAQEVYVHFAPPFLYRTRRDCEFFDPSSFDPAAKLEKRDETPAGPPPPDSYSAGELNQLTRYFRRESQAAWGCQIDSRCDEGQAAQRLNWREMFLMAEAVDEAWIALSAAQAMHARKGSAQEIADADAAKAAASQRIRDLGAKALARAGDSVAGIAVSVTQSNYGRDAAGLFVEIAGTLTNTSDIAKTVDALMVAFVDRLELPLASVAAPFERVLAPGETVPFAQRLGAAAARGTEGVQMAWGERREAAPARIPPSTIAWQVRVGAVAKPR